MNIGFLINFTWFPIKGGGTVHAYQFVRQMTKRGHKIHSVFYHAQAPEVSVYRQRQLFQFLKSIDLLYIRIDGKWGMERFTCLKLLKAMKLPVVWEINAPIDEMLMRGKSSREVQRWNRLRTLMARWVDVAICVSKEMEQYARNQLGIKHVHVVPNGSDTTIFSPEKRDRSIYADFKDHFKLVWAGSAYYAWQGWGVIVQVARKMKTIDPKVRFILITKTEDIDVKEEIPDNVVIPGEKDYLELSPYLASADAGLCLYNPLTHNQKFYFSPLKLFDYMACGLPVIATAVGQINEIIKDKENGLLVSHDVNEIIDRICFLKDHPQEAAQMGVMARRRVEEFYNWDRVGEETEKILCGLLTGKSS